MTKCFLDTFYEDTLSLVLDDKLDVPGKEYFEKHLGESGDFRGKIFPLHVLNTLRFLFAWRREQEDFFLPLEDIL